MVSNILPFDLSHLRIWMMAPFLFDFFFVIKRPLWLTLRFVLQNCPFNYRIWKKKNNENAIWFKTVQSQNDCKNNSARAPISKNKKENIYWNHWMVKKSVFISFRGMSFSVDIYLLQQLWERDPFKNCNE